MGVQRQIGAALLVMALILMLGAGLFMVYTAVYSVLQQKTVTNQQNNHKAFAAAEAGLDYAIAYLVANGAAIIASASSGSISYTIATTTQADNSTYSAVITNPTVNDYARFQITATGISPDGSATRIISQQVYAGGSSVQYAMTTQGSVTTSGSTTVTGTYGINAGGVVTQSGASNVSSITQNNTSIASMTGDQFFSSIFGSSEAAIQASSTYYASSSSVPWSTLSGSVWINGSVVLSGNTTIGSATNPVTLIINGSFTGSGNLTVNGLLYTMNGVTLSGSFNANGGVLSQGSIIMSGNSNIAYNATILNKLSIGGGSNYSTIPGSWLDF